MKKVIVVLVGVVLLSGCRPLEQPITLNVVSFCDTKYGVEYISREGVEGLSLRVSRDGTPVTCKMDGE